MKISIMVPVYNEESTLESITRLIQASLLDLWKKQKIKSEVILVDDGSRDNTPTVIRKLKKKYSNIMAIRKKNGGKGSAIRTAMQHATGDVLIVQDADMEYDPKDYKELLKPFQKQKALVVYGSRRSKEIKNKQVSHVSFFIGGRVITWMTNIIYLRRLTDEPTCYKCFHKSILKNIMFEGNGFEWEPEITAKIIRRGYKIFEVPIHYYPRTVAEGKKINYRDGIKAITTLLKWRFKKL